MHKLLFPGILRVVLALGFAPSAAFAICNVDYVAKPGDNLFSIAEEHYGDRERWSLIYYRNQRLLAASTVIPGRTLFIPCPEEEIVPDATPLRKVDAEMTLLTGGNFGPFSGQDLPGQGMVTELVNAALELAPSPVSYAVSWEDDWSQHLFPMLDDKQFDMGFPWIKPDCEADPAHERCVRFHFSDPVVSLPMMLFVDAERPFAFTETSDLNGKTICRPVSFSGHNLDETKRSWMTEADVTIVNQPQPQGCFALLHDGDVDAVAMNLFLGVETIVAEGLREQVVPLERPISQEDLSVVISKRHWRGTSHLYRVNAGLKALRDSGRFEQIMTRHLEAFWSQIQ
ncbi:transporter substrate-binding domain-containing protein [Epibacterium ulvae]|uniref:transporter substrate-binding domain-containing protein n=1 Tax=Epibacterium ulvae TaxID=1156985 RepID=UPI001BFC8301|nr:transporter substrate-binding domain-containing protein [Epibacterium ulvae]MBT8153044.1 transporter substrate-binding domain-containing protein [Epibacterium ulvae]